MGTNVLPAGKSFVHSHHVPLHMKRMTWHHQLIFVKTAKKDEKRAPSCSGVKKTLLNFHSYKTKFNILNELC